MALGRLAHLLLAALVCAPLWTAAAARAQCGDAAAYVAALGAKAIAIVNQDGLTAPARDARLRALLAGGVDFETMGELALGGYWKRASVAQRLEYRALFRDQLMDRYVGLLGRQAGARLAVQDDADSRAGHAYVDARIVSAGGDTIDTRWRLRCAGDGPRIVDVSAQGVSLIAFYRASFIAVSAREGLDALLAKLRRKVTGEG